MNSVIFRPLPQRGVLVEDLLHTIQRESHSSRLVGLDADAVEGHAAAFGRGQQLEECRPAVGQHVVVVDDQARPGIGQPGPAVRLVDLWLGQMRRFVDDLPELDFAAVSLDDVFDALPLDIRRRLAFGPRRHARLVAPKQRMAFHADPVLPAPSDDLVGVRVVRLAALRLIPSPVEADRGVVEQLREPPLVSGVLRSRYAHGRSRRYCRRRGSHG